MIRLPRRVWPAMTIGTRGFNTRYFVKSAVLRALQTTYLLYNDDDVDDLATLCSGKFQVAAVFLCKAPSDQRWFKQLYYPRSSLATPSAEHTSWRLVKRGTLST